MSEDAFREKTVIVTGASSGIGRALALQLADAGPSGRAIDTGRMITADQCARIILRAARRRKRQVVMWPGFPGIWLKMILRDRVDRLTISSFLPPAIKRVSSESGSE
ncbi:MAG: hypothetical protein MUQ10_14285 [Anaerolineae bacterium]|nr:hypothetical protein [Anaerolineae bacterium]